MNEFQTFMIGGGVGVAAAVGVLAWYMVHRHLAGVASDISDIKNWIQAHFPAPIVEHVIKSEPTAATTSEPHA
jgi:hypothetical protein